jgi:hypothetical protein
MIRKQAQEDRNDWLARLNPLRRTPAPVQRAVAYPVPPSRKNRKALTTWQDEAALKQIKHLAAQRGVSQQALIAEGINHVLAKYGKPTVAT